MSAQAVFGIQDLRQEILLWKTQAELVNRKKIENERIKKCRNIYPAWRVVPIDFRRVVHEPTTAKIIPGANMRGQTKWEIKHNNTLLVYPVTYGWWHHRFIWGPPGI